MVSTVTIIELNYTILEGKIYARFFVQLVLFVSVVVHRNQPQCHSTNADVNELVNPTDWLFFQLYEVRTFVYNLPKTCVFAIWFYLLVEKSTWSKSMLLCQVYRKVANTNEKKEDFYSIQSTSNDIDSDD